MVETKIEYEKFVGLSSGRFEISYDDRSLKELTQVFDKHYICHTAWAARVLADLRPEKHVDIASSVFFNAAVSAFVPIDFYDFRHWRLGIDNLKTGFEDVRKLSFGDGTIPSLSCMHVVEHIGLGRYGEDLDPEGDLKSIAELKRVLAPGGDLLFVVPIGEPKVIFNLHRVYGYDQIISYFSGLRLVEFALVPDKTPGDLIRKACGELADRQEFGCGCFWFRKDEK
jgi:SAM-dependent methyltransferase